MTAPHAPRLRIDLPGLGIYARGPFAWFRVLGYGLHLRHESAGQLLFSERKKQRSTFLGWRISPLVPDRGPLTDLITRATARRRRWSCGPLALETVPVGPPGKPFLRRLALTAWRAKVMLHLHEGSDAREGMSHSHPIAMLSFMLRGGLVEFRPLSGEWLTHWKRNRWNWIPSGVYHRITPFRQGALTLVFGWLRKDGKWGFYNEKGRREIPADSDEGQSLIFVKPEAGR